MAIVRKQVPPTSGAKAVGMALRDLRHGKAANNELFAQEDLLGGAQINLAEPLPVYSLGLDDLTDHSSLNKAKQTGWRYLVEGGGGAQVGFADVKETGGGGARFAGLARNRNAERLMEAVHLAQTVAGDVSEDCEARILDVPALNVSAVWLSCSKPLFIPYIDVRRLSKPGAKIEVVPGFFEQLVRDAAIMRELHNNIERRAPPEPMLTND